MRNYLTENEAKVADKIINIALAYAAESFTRLAKKDVYLNSIETISSAYVSNASGSQNQVASFSENLIKIISGSPTFSSTEFLYVMTTEVKGQLNAESFLIMTRQDAKEVCQIMLGDDNIMDREIMEEAILLEIDNILTASVVSQFSNFFKLKMYGDVPNIKKLNIKQSQELIEKQMVIFNLPLVLKTNFTSTTHDIQTRFLWVFTHSFIDAIKTLNQDKEKLEELKNYDNYIKQFIRL